MKLVALILALLLCLPSAASAITTQQAADHLKWAGIDSNVEVKVDNTADDANGVFVQPGCYAVDMMFEFCVDHPIIQVWQPQDVPDDIAYHILFHEYTHYLQWKNHETFSSSVDMERDADAGATQLLCKAGFDGVGIMTRLAYWFQAHGYLGDPQHGSYLARLVSAKAHAPACEVAPQAP